MIEGQVRVLLLDDEESLRVPLKDYLERHFGYHVDAVATSEEMFRQLRAAQGHFDVALIDEVLLQPPDGIEVMRQIKARYSDIECIIFTGWGVKSRQKALQAGAFRYLEKPFDNDELAMLIRAAAQQVRLRGIGRAILSERKLDQVLGRIEAAATSLALADEAAISLLDSDAGRVRVHTKSYPGQIEWKKHFKNRDLSKDIIETGKTIHILDTTQDDRVNPDVREAGIRSFVGLPIPGKEGNLGVLYVYSRRPGRFNEGSTLAVLQTLAGQAGLAIANAQAFQQIQAHADYMEALVQAGQGFTRMTDLEKQLQLAWDFVRKQLQIATFFVALYDEQRDLLRFPLVYDEDKQVELPERHLGDDPKEWNITGYVIRTGQELHWSTKEEAQQKCRSLGIKAQRIGKPSQSSFFLPLRIGNDVIGAISVQSYQRYAFSPILLDAFRALGSQLTVTIANARLLEETRQGLTRLQAAYEASKGVIAAREPNGALKVVVEKALQAMEAWWVKLVLIDEQGRPYYVKAMGSHPGGDLSRRIRPDGISLQVIHSGEPIFVGDVDASKGINPAMREEGVGAAACLPFAPQGRPIGVLWVHYKEPRSFSEAEQQALRLYASQAAIAYNNAWRMEELKQMHAAAAAMSRITEPREALQQIVNSAARILQADSAAIWSYDEVRHIFIPEELVAVGIPGDELERFKGEEPKPGRTADTVMRKGYLAVTDILQPGFEFLGPSTRKLLSRINVRSFQGIALKVSEERLGVLYVNYKHPQSFDEEDKRMLRIFASHAALALKNARLLYQLQRTREAAGVIAGIALQENLERTLKTIAQRTQQVLHGEVVTIYSYDEVKGQFGEWTAEISDSRRPGSARPPKKLLPNSVVWSILNLTGPPYYHLAEEHADDDSLLGGRFVKAEEIQAALGIQLRVGEHRVGVMFVDYRSPHRFTSDEIATVQLFANQAAVAIRNAQLYKRRRALYDGLLKASGAAIVAGKFHPTMLKVIADVVRENLGCDVVSLYAYYESKKEITYPSVIAGDLLQKDKQADWDAARLSNRLKIEGKKGGLVLRYILTEHRKPVYASDVSTHPILRKRNFIKREQIKSSAIIPLQSDNKMVGIMFVNYRSPHLFVKEDQEMLDLFATQAAIAIQNAQQYDELRRTQGLVGSRTALAWMGMASSAWRHEIDKHAVTIRDLVQLLRKDLEQALSHEHHTKVDERLSMIERLTDQILKKPIVPPLSSEEGVEVMGLNDFVGERAKQLWKNDPYKKARLRLDLRLPGMATVRVSPEWLRRAFDILVDNAVEAVADSDVREITIGTRPANGGVQIWISDTGTGIPEEIQAKIGVEPIEKPGHAKGLGMGLLMAQTIVQTYGGELRVASTGPTGTTMVIHLPVSARE